VRRRLVGPQERVSDKLFALRASQYLVEGVRLSQDIHSSTSSIASLDPPRRRDAGAVTDDHARVGISARQHGTTYIVAKGKRAASIGDARSLIDRTVRPPSNSKSRNGSARRHGRDWSCAGRLGAQLPKPMKGTAHAWQPESISLGELNDSGRKIEAG
jgi:hypothetical protein